VAETRRYDGALRLAKTRQARVRILDVARELFVADGYVGTTVDAVAARAGVSPQTVYNLVGGKATLFKTVWDVTLAGDDEPIPLFGRPEFQPVFDAPTARASLAAYAGVAETLWGRIGPLVTLAFAQAAAGDRDLRALVETIETERATGTRTIVGIFAERFGLRPGLTVDVGTDIVWTLTSPDIVERLVERRGWAWPRYQEWLVDTIHHGLFGP